LHQSSLFIILSTIAIIATIAAAVFVGGLGSWVVTSSVTSTPSVTTEPTSVSYKTSSSENVCPPSSKGVTLQTNTSVWSFAISLSTECLTQSQNSVYVLENLTNISNQPQSFYGEEMNAHVYPFHLFGNNQSCYNADANWGVGNFTISPSESLYWNATVPTYVYYPYISCDNLGNAESLPIGTYTIEIYAPLAVGTGTGDNTIPIPPLITINATINIVPSTTSSTYASTASTTTIS
jgi:hypothetical protein